MLVIESIKPITFKSENQCQVALGEWVDPYSGLTVTEATKLDIDHMVPIKNAHDSGGWAWSKDKKGAYANASEYANHLIAVTASANRQKGSRGPDQWKPTKQDYWCTYAVDWVQIKIYWGLSATKSELTALQQMLQSCSDTPSFASVTYTHTAKSTPSPISTQLPLNPTTTPTATIVVSVIPTNSSVISTADSSNIKISAIDCQSKPEIVLVKNGGLSSQDLTGWRIEDNGANFSFTFPIGFSIKASKSVKLVSGEPGNDTGEVLYWINRTVWNNDRDTASLFNSSGQLVDKIDCP